MTGTSYPPKYQINRLHLNDPTGGCFVCQRNRKIRYNGYEWTILSINKKKKKKKKQNEKHNK
jgi:hypothetical protein